MALRPDERSLTLSFCAPITTCVLCSPLLVCCTACSFALFQGTRLCLIFLRGLRPCGPACAGRLPAAAPEGTCAGRAIKACSMCRNGCKREWMWRSPASLAGASQAGKVRGLEPSCIFRRQSAEIGVGCNMQCGVGIAAVDPVKPFLQTVASQRAERRSASIHTFLVQLFQCLASPSALSTNSSTAAAVDQPQLKHIHTQLAGQSYQNTSHGSPLHSRCSSSSPH